MASGESFCVDGEVCSASASAAAASGEALELAGAGQSRVDDEVISAVAAAGKVSALASGEDPRVDDDVEVGVLERSAWSTTLPVAYSVPLTAWSRDVAVCWFR